MISYKVLMTLTVIYIISRSAGSPTFKDYEKCEDVLKKVGFSDDFGFLNYCFAKQFLIVVNFTKHVEKVFDTNPSPAIKDIAKAFFDENRSYFKTSLHDDLYAPATYCFEYINTNFITDVVETVFCIPSVGPRFERDGPEVADCAGKIISCPDNDEVVQLINTNGNIIEDIKYVKNKYKNAIKSYNLSLVKKNSIVKSKKYGYLEQRKKKILRRSGGYFKKKQGIKLVLNYNTMVQK